MLKFSDLYKPENNQYFGPNKPCQTIVLDTKSWGRGCIMLLERNTFGYRTRPAGYKIRRTLVLEVWEYDSKGELQCLVTHDLNTKLKRLGRRAFDKAILDNNEAGEPALVFQG